jgi:hypothetical protein
MHPLIIAAGQIFTLAPELLTGTSRARPVVLARAAAAWSLRQRLTLSLHAIGRELGGRDHSTIRNLLAVAERGALADLAYARQLWAVADAPLGHAVCALCGADIIPGHAWEYARAYAVGTPDAAKRCIHSACIAVMLNDMLPRYARARAETRQRWETEDAA